LDRAGDLFRHDVHERPERNPCHSRTAAALIDEWHSARERHGWVIGRYVIMPDHVHFFCVPELEAKTLSDFVGAWKRWTSRRIHALRGRHSTSVAGLPRSATAATTGTALWQREFFDHVLRSKESYNDKWNYVRDNPVRAGLAVVANDWPYAGELERLEL
jgi:putative transposase